MRLSSLAFLLPPMFTLGCGALAEEDASTPASAGPTAVPALPTPACSRPRTAPLTKLTDVTVSSARVGPCGDLAYQKTDGSLWLRLASGDGASIELAPAGRNNGVSGFDPTGTYVAFERGAPAGSFVRDLDTGAEIALPDTARFGLDPATGKPIVFTCNHGIHVLRAGSAGVGEAVPGSEGQCGPFAPYGPKVLVLDDARTGARVIDLVRETSLRLAIDYLGAGPLRDGRRLDDIQISRDGAMVFHEMTTWTTCGDTDCPSANGFDLVSTSTGKPTQHVAGGFVRLDSALDLDGARAGALLLANGRADSIDTTMGRYVERADASLVILQDDGTLILKRADPSGSRVLIGRAGDEHETEWLRTPTNATTFVAWPKGRRLVLLERTSRVQTSDGQSTWAGGDYGDLVVRDEAGAEIGRHPRFTEIEPVAFPSDGAVILSATRYAGAPPASAESSDALGLLRSLVRVGSDGALTIVADGTDTSEVLELDERSMASLASRYDAATASYTSTYTIYDIALSGVRRTISAPRLYPLRPSWPRPVGVVAVEEGSGTSTAGEAASVWHGVADR